MARPEYCNDGARGLPALNDSGKKVHRREHHKKKLRIQGEKNILNMIIKKICEVCFEISSCVFQDLDFDDQLFFC